MIDTLRFDPEKYQIKKLQIENETIEYRQYRDILYCANPLDDIQKMNLFVPEDYYEGRTINGYDLHSAPILLPNTVGGYMPGPCDEPGMNIRVGKPNYIFQALKQFDVLQYFPHFISFTLNTYYIFLPFKYISYPHLQVITTPSPSFLP